MSPSEEGESGEIVGEKYETECVTQWDRAAVTHLENARSLYDDAGVLPFVRQIVGQVWSKNRARWSPARHFDDTNTLGYQTSRNVNNQIVASVGEADVSPAVRSETETGVVMLRLADFRLRVVKAPIESGLAPDFMADFDWTTSATRESAARRNSNAYYPFGADEWTLRYDGDPRSIDQRNVEMCRDLFLLWAADLESDRTAGWLGLPRLGDQPWMAIVDIWRDDLQEDAAKRSDVREDDPDTEGERDRREDDD